MDRFRRHLFFLLFLLITLLFLMRPSLPPLFLPVPSSSSTSSPSFSSYSSSSEDEDEDEDENRRRAAAADTSYSSIDELLDRSVVLNSRLEALEQRARHLATASSKPPDASSKQTE